MRDRFGCALDCMDGRTTEAVTNFLRRKYGIRWVDSITAPGINKILAESLDECTIKKIKNDLGISIQRHNSEVVAITGHPECGGNPADKERQIKQLRIAKKNVEAFGFDIDIVLLWVENDWETVEEVDFNFIQA